MQFKCVRGVRPASVVSFVTACVAASSSVALGAGPVKKTRAAMVRVETAVLRSGPASQHKPTALLDSGRSARVVGRKNGWLKLRLASGTEGWVRSDLMAVNRKATKTKSDSASFSGKKAARLAKLKAAKAEAAKQVKFAQARQAKVAKIAQAKAEAKAHVKRLHLAKLAKLAQAKAAQKKAAQQKVTRLAQIRKAEQAKQVATLKVRLAKAEPATFVAVPRSEADAQMGSRLARTQSEMQDLGSPVAAEPDGELRLVSLSAPSASASSPASSRQSTRADRIVRTALAYRGTPYRRGATGRGAFDCSGFTYYLFGKEGERLPRTAAEQFTRGQHIEKTAMLPGDLVFFKNTYKQGVSHVGIFIGNGQFVHAASTGRGVRVDDLSKSFYINHWAGARRPR